MDEEPEYQVKDEVSESDEELETNIGEKELRTIVEKDQYPDMEYFDKRENGCF